MAVSLITTSPSPNEVILKINELIPLLNTIQVDWGNITGTLSEQLDLQAALNAKAEATTLATHLSNTDNPHAITPEKIGAVNINQGTDKEGYFMRVNAQGKVVPVTYLSLTTWGEIGGSIANQTDLKEILDAKATTAALTTHTSNNSNPHNITCEQIDAVKVTQGADKKGYALIVNDEGKLAATDIASTHSWGKIVGTLSDQTDLQAALDEKADEDDLTAHTSNTSNPHGVTLEQVGGCTLTSDGFNGSEKVSGNTTGTISLEDGPIQFVTATSVTLPTVKQGYSLLLFCKGASLTFTNDNIEWQDDTVPTFDPGTNAVTFIGSRDNKWLAFYGGVFPQLI